MTDVQKLNELFHSGWTIGGILGHGDNGHLFVLERLPDSPMEGEGWKGGKPDEEDD